MPVHDWTCVDPGIFHDFHLEWIAAVKHALNEGLLPEGYYALAEQIASRRELDVLALSTHPNGTSAQRANPGPQGGVAVAVRPPCVQFVARTEPPTSARQSKIIAIRHVSDDRVVALVEVVSPGNKSSVYSLESFVTKAVEFLRAGIHLLILDLFGPSARDPQGIHGAVWGQIGPTPYQPPADKPLTLVAYESDLQVTAYVEPIAVNGQLPDMPLFLEPGTYVLVPLEVTYQAAFARVPRRWRDVVQSPAAGGVATPGPPGP